MSQQCKDRLAALREDVRTAVRALENGRNPNVVAAMLESALVESEEEES